MEDRQLEHYINSFKKTGENSFFENIYKFYFPKILRFISLNISDIQAAEEISSEVFVKVYRYLNKMNLNAPGFRAWIYKIARNLIIDFYRKQSRTIKASSLDKYFEEKSALTEDIDPEIDKNLVFENDKDFSAGGFDTINIRNLDFLEKLNRLPELQKQVLILRFVEDMDYKAIGKVINRNERTARIIKFRAIAKLREMVK